MAEGGSAKLRAFGPGRATKSRTRSSSAVKRARSLASRTSRARQPRQIGSVLATTKAALQLWPETIVAHRGVRAIPSGCLAGRGDG